MFSLWEHLAYCLYFFSSNSILFKPVTSSGVSCDNIF